MKYFLENSTEMLVHSSLLEIDSQIKHQFANLSIVFYLKPKTYQDLLGINTITY